MDSDLWYVYGCKKAPLQVWYTVKPHFMDTHLIQTLVIMECFLGPAPYIFLKINLLNKMPILAFTRDTVPDLFPLYASQIFKAILPSQLKYYVTVLKIIPEISF